MEQQNNSINKEQLEGAKAILKQRFPIMIEGYIEDVMMYLESIQEGLTQRDLEQVSFNAHTMKSASSGLGIVKVADLAKEIEKLSKTNDNTDKVIELVEQLQQEVEAVIPELTRFASNSEG